MRWIFFSPILLFASVSNDINIGLYSLQQIRTLVPERLSEEVFSIRVDRDAFEKAFAKRPSHSMQQPGIASMPGIGTSHFYYSRMIFSGEPMRILDAYQEFEYVPYWMYPTALNKLYDMEPHQ